MSSSFSSQSFDLVVCFGTIMRYKAVHIERTYTGVMVRAGSYQITQHQGIDGKRSSIEFLDSWAVKERW